MTSRTLSEQQTTLSQVWANLTKEHQTGVIQLMAQLVLKLIIEQIETSRKEVGDAIRTGTQNPG